MSYVLLAIVVVMVAFQEVAKKQYTVTDEKPNFFFFSGVTCCFAGIFFLLTSKFQLEFSWAVANYSFWFGIAFLSAQIGAFLAIKWGSLAISMLFCSYSLIIPTIHGMIAYHERLGMAGIVGLIFLFTSIFLICNRNEKACFSLKWLFAVLLLFFGNGFCSSIQKMQQVAFCGSFKHELMIIAMAFCTLIQLLMSFLTKEKISRKLSFSLPWGAVSGFANGIVNLLVMVLSASIPNAILFPSISAGGIVLGFLMAVLYYQEKLTKVQMVGYVLGTVSVILLNL